MAKNMALVEFEPAVSWKEETFIEKSILSSDLCGGKWKSDPPNDDPQILDRPTHHLNVRQVITREPAVGFRRTKYR